MNSERSSGTAVNGDSFVDVDKANRAINAHDTSYHLLPSQFQLEGTLSLVDKAPEPADENADNAIKRESFSEATERFVSDLRQAELFEEADAARHILSLFGRFLAGDSEYYVEDGTFIPSPPIDIESADTLINYFKKQSLRRRLDNDNGELSAQELITEVVSSSVIIDSVEIDSEDLHKSEQELQLRAALVSIKDGLREDAKK